LIWLAAIALSFVQFFVPGKDNGIVVDDQLNGALSKTATSLKGNFMSFRLSTLSLAAGVVVAALSAPAFAAEQQGWYLGASAGYAKNTISNIEHPTGISEKTRNTGFKVYGGYQFNPYWATEIEVISLGKYTANYPAGANYHASVKTTGIGISGIGMLPLSEQFGLFGKLGVLNKYTQAQAYSDYGYASENKITTVALLGGGAEYHFTPNLTLRAEYEYFGKTAVSKDDIKITNSLLSLGMHYRF
jgi:OOP family OmpA-OmpF porin